MHTSLTNANSDVFFKTHAGKVVCTRELRKDSRFHTIEKKCIDQPTNLCFINVTHPESMKLQCDLGEVK